MRDSLGRRPPLPPLEVGAAGPAPMPVAPLQAASRDHILVPVQTPETWRWVRDIRQAALGLEPAADGTPQEAADLAANRQTFMLLHLRRPVGTVRLETDLAHDRLILQRVAILPGEQRRGHGAALLRQVALMANALGATALVANAAHAAVPWYLRNRFEFLDWDPARATVTSRQMGRAMHLTGRREVPAEWQAWRDLA